MALYRHDASGILVERSSPPGAGYTSISSMPNTNDTDKAAWWRALDTYGLASQWSPLTPYTGGGESTLPPGAVVLHGSGVNVLPQGYTSFDADQGLPSLTAASCTLTQQSGSFDGTKYLRAVTTASSSAIYFSSTSGTENFALTPGKKWIASWWMRCGSSTTQNIYAYILDANVQSFYGLKSVTFAANVWQRVSIVVDASAGTSARALFAIAMAGSGLTYSIDNVMLEEQIGTGEDPSAFSEPPATVDGGSIDDGSVLDRSIQSLSVAKLDAGTITSKNIYLNSGMIASVGYSPGVSGWKIDGDGDAEFQNVTVRGTLNASDLYAGTVPSGRFGDSTIGASPIVANSLHRHYGSFSYVSVPYYASAPLWGGYSTTTLVSLPANPYRTAIAIHINLNMVGYAATAGGYLQLAPTINGVLTSGYTGEWIQNAVSEGFIHCTWYTTGYTSAFTVGAAYQQSYRSSSTEHSLCIAVSEISR